LIKAAVLGSPIAHSLSPRLHNAAYKFLNIPGTYSSFDVPMGNLQNFLSDKADSWSGFSLTMPLKEEALSCVDDIDPLVHRIKSGNTLVNEDGVWKLFSTDVIGFRNSWKLHNADVPSSVLIIGAGATARAAAAAFDSASTRIQVVHRNPDREMSMRDCLLDSSIDFLPWKFDDKFLEADLVINTTPKFALDDFSYALSSQPSGVFFDVLYDPWPTQFAQRWSQLGGTVIGGLELLIAQGVEQIKFFTGEQIPTEELTSFLRKEFAI
jgi:shikimate dehydrogenase